MFALSLSEEIVSFPRKLQELLDNLTALLRLGRRSLRWFWGSWNWSKSHGWGGSGRRSW